MTGIREVTVLCCRQLWCFTAMLVSHLSEGLNEELYVSR